MLIERTNIATEKPSKANAETVKAREKMFSAMAEIILGDTEALKAEAKTISGDAEILKAEEKVISAAAETISGEAKIISAQAATPFSQYLRASSDYGWAKVENRLAWAKIRDIISVNMCCRMSNSGFATRTIAGLYILLFTFLIGYFAVKTLSWETNTNLRSPDILDKASVDEPPAIAKSLDQLASCQNTDGLSITKSYVDNYSLKPTIVISNRGKHSIDYIDADFASGDGVTGHLPIIPRVDSKTKVLKSSDIAVFYHPYNEAESAFEITFWYRLEKKRSWHYLSAYFPEGNSKPSRCFSGDWSL